MSTVQAITETTAAAQAAESAGTAAAAGVAGSRRPGRPRSERADQAIIDAALSLFAESGPEGLCIEKVAARAGVGKATIYRRWPGKEDLLLDAIASLKTPLPEPAGQSVRADLVNLLAAMCQFSADPRRAREFALLLGEGAKYPRLMARYLETVVEPRREVFRSVLRRGVATGELRADTDIEAALFMLIGAVLVRGRYEAEAVTPDYAGRVVDELLQGLAPR
ncbi:MAG TPA: TetR/AcrR family transcriptional regulator [Streptosporangiaceae bacterium]